MYVPVEQLVDGLRSRFAIKTYNILPTQTVAHTAPFPRSQGNENPNDNLSSDTLYLCSYWDLRHIGNKMINGIFLCVMDSDDSPDPIMLAKRPTIVVNNATVDDVLFSLNDLMYQYGRRSSNVIDISRLLLHCSSIEQLLEESYRILGNPLVLTDLNKHIILHTDPSYVRHAAYTKITSLDTLPSHSLTQMEISSKNLRWITSQIPSYVARDSELPAYYMKQIHSNAIHVGHLFVLQYNREFQEDDAYIIELIGNLIMAHTQELELLRLTKNDIVGQLFRDILECRASTNEQIDSRLQSLKLTLNSHLRYVIIAPKGNMQTDSMAQIELASSIRKVLPNSIPFLYNDSINVLFSYNHLNQSLRDYLEPFRKLMERKDLSAAVSNEFSSLTQMRQFSFQCIKTLDISAKLHHISSVFYYADYTVFHLIEAAMMDGAFEDYCMPEVLKLLSYCRNNGDELMETLKQYLGCCCHKSQTAAILDLHPHTVRNRIEQIESIMNTDLHDWDTLVHLTISLKMLQYFNFLE